MAITAILSCSLNAMKKSPPPLPEIYPLENNKNNLAEIKQAYQSKFGQNIEEDIDIKKLMPINANIAVSWLTHNLKSITANLSTPLNNYVQNTYKKLKDPNIPQDQFNNYLSRTDALVGHSIPNVIQQDAEDMKNFYKLLIIWNKILELPEIKKRINTGKKPTILDNQRTLAIFQSKLIGLHYHA